MSSKSEAGKGDRYRPVDREVYRRNYERINWEDGMKDERRTEIVDADGDNPTEPHEFRCDCEGAMEIKMGPDGGLIHAKCGRSVSHMLG